MHKNPNRTMSREDFQFPAIRKAADHVQETMELLHSEGLIYSHWCGQLDDKHRPSTVANKGPNYEPLTWAYDDESIPWFTLWEYSWLLHCSKIMRKKKPRKILSLGGSSSSLEATLARLGHSVTVIEQRPYTVENARKNAAALSWDMDVIQGDIADIGTLVEDAKFDMVFSTSVLFLAGAIAQEAVARHLWMKMDPSGDGLACTTFDFLNPNPARCVSDPISHFKWDHFSPWPPAKEGFHDNGERHHFYYPDPEKGYYTAGALFQKLIP